LFQRCSVDQWKETDGSRTGRGAFVRLGHGLHSSIGDGRERRKERWVGYLPCTPLVAAFSITKIS
jgi:hypothetical protein